MGREQPSVPGTTLTEMQLPPIVPPTPEEIARRRALFEEVMALREKIGAIGLSTAELVREVREEADASNE